MQTDDSLASNSETAPADPTCLCCATRERPVVTLTTAFVHYLRCSSCGFIWIVRISDPARSPLSEVPQSL